jgi:hypothetical protein
MTKYLNILSYFVLGEVFLSIIFERLPFPFYSYNFWQILWFISLLLFKPRIFVHKLLLASYIGLVYYAVQHFILSKPIEQSFAFFQYYIYIVSALTMFIYTISQNTMHISGLSRYSICIIFFSSITSIVGFLIFPESIRFNPEFHISHTLGREQLKYYSSIGIMNYSFFYGLALSMPVLYVWVKDNFAKRTVPLHIIVVLLLVFSIVQSNFATAFLMSVIGLFLVLIGYKNFVRYKLLIIFVIILLFFIQVNFFSGVISSLSSYLPDGSVLQSRIQDLVLTIQGQETTHGSARLDRIPLLLANFLKSPLFGSGFTLGHNFLFDILSCFGIVGLIPYLILFIKLFHFVRKLIDNRLRYYYSIYIIVFIIYISLKGAPGKEVYIFTIFLVPIFLVSLQSIKRT